jgi:hypothetical protein
MYLAHVYCASDGGSHLVVDSVRRAQPPWSSFFLPSLSSSFFSTRQMVSLMPIELSKARNFNPFQLELAYT